VEEDTMVMLRSTEPVTYELFDEQGQRLGQVVLPKDAVITGSQAGTVLLRRDIPMIRSKWVGTPRAA
jgi:hypothetical protein